MVTHSLATSDLDIMSKIEIYVSCEDLPNLDFTSVSDPFIECLIEGEEGEWDELGSTEIQPDTLSPKFVKSIFCQYNIKSPPKLKFVIYDVDGCISNETVTEKDLIGEAEFYLKDLLESNKMQLMLRL